MHHDQVRLYPQLLQGQDAFFDMPEMNRVKPVEIPVISFRFSCIAPEILLGQHAGIHGRPLIGIRSRLSQVIVIMLGKNTEADFVECTCL